MLTFYERASQGCMGANGMVEYGDSVEGDEGREWSELDHDLCE